MSKRVIINVTFGEKYHRYQDRLRESIAVHAPNVATMFWRDELPPNSPDHWSTPYGFKFAAIMAAAEAGFDQVIWMDAGGYFSKPIGALWDAIDEHGYYVAAQAQPLGAWSSDDALKYYEFTRDECFVKDYRLLCGMPYGFDLRHTIGRRFFAQWFAAMEAGLFTGPYLNLHASAKAQRARRYRTQGEVSPDTRCEGHRHDETIGALLAYRHGYRIDPFGNLCGGDSADGPSVCVKSGYTLPRLGPTGKPEVLANHSMIFPIDGPVLDVGAYQGDFSRAVRDRGCIVFALEPNPDIADPAIPGVRYIRRALVAPGKPREIRYTSFGNGTGNFIDQHSHAPADAKVVMVPTIEMPALMAELQVEHWGAVKMNCEGEEFDILRKWPGPIADQVCVAFHDHIGANPYPKDPERVYREIMDRMNRWYDVRQHVKDHRYGVPTATYWDTLFVLKGGA